MTLVLPTTPDQKPAHKFHYQNIFPFKEWPVTKMKNGMSLKTVISYYNFLAADIINLINSHYNFACFNF